MENYRIYNFNDRDVYVTGDLHGNFSSLMNYLKNFNIENAVIIVAGDIGIGFELPEYYHQTYLATMKKYLEANNVDIICVRGNHDDPSFFNDPLCVINEPRWKTIPDYSIVRIYNGLTEDVDVTIKEHLIPTKSILCIGGATSIDRVERIRFEHKSIVTNQKYGSRIRRSYWKDEHPIYNENILNKIKEDGILIDDVVTHTCPSFSHPIHKNGIKFWLLIDKDLEEDLNHEREIMDNIYYHLREDKHPIANWIYGHYHSSFTEYHDTIKFTLLNCVDYKFEMFNILRMDIEEETNI